MNIYDKIRVMDRAIDRMGDPKTWTTATTARSASGKRVDSTDENAVGFCALGHIMRSEYDLFGYISLPTKLAGQANDFSYRLTGFGLWKINDTFGREEALGVMRSFHNDLVRQAVAEAQEVPQPVLA